jgi:hypothetical protein
MSVSEFIWGNTAYYKIEIHGPVVQSDDESGDSGIPNTRTRARETALEQLRYLLAPNYLWAASHIWYPEELEIVEEDSGAMAQSTGRYNVVYRISKEAADAAAQQPHVLAPDGGNARPTDTAPAEEVVTGQEIADACPDRAAFAIHEDKYKVTVVLNDVDLDIDSTLNIARMEAEFESARQIAANFNSSISSDQIRYQSEAPSGHYVGPPGQPGVRIQGLGAIMREVPEGSGTQYQCISGTGQVASTGKFIGSYSAPVSGVTNVSVVPGGDEAAAGEDPSETGPAGDTSQDAPPAAPLGAGDANPDAPPGVEEREGNYVITVIVPEGEDPQEVAKDELAKYVTDSSRARASNISVEGDLAQLDSSPAASGDVSGKKILIMGDSQWHGTAMGRAVKESLEAKGAEVRTLWQYGKGAAVGASHFGVSVAGSTGNTTVNPTGLLGSMLTSFQPNIVIIGLGGNDSYGWNNKKDKYKKVLEGWITAFKNAGVSEVRWLGPSFATNIMSNGRSYDTIRQKIREHQQEYLSSSPVSGIQTTWTDTVSITRDLERKEDGVHYVSGARGYGGWGTIMTSDSGPLADLMTGSAPGAERVQFAVPAGNVRVTSQPPKGGTGYEPPPAGAFSPGKEGEKGEKTPAEINLEPLDFQCVLMQNIRLLAAEHKSAKYDHTCRLTSDNPGNVMSIINHGNMTNEVREFLSLCPEVYGALVPFLKIWRVEYNDKGKVLKNSDGTPKEKELRIPNFVDERDVDDILAGKKSRISGAGIKSFSWELKGVQPAEVDNNITAKLDIYFQSVGDFFGGATQAGGNVPNFLDLIINSPAVRKVKNKSGIGSQSPSSKPRRCGTGAAAAGQYDGANFRIKVCAGWAVPEDLESMFPTTPPAKLKLLREAVMATRSSLFLQQVRHNITFNENGSMLLSIDYHAALTGMLRGSTADIFADGKNLDEITKLRDEKKELARQSKDPDATESEKEKLGEDTDLLLEKIDELEQADKLEKYRKLLKGLFESDKIMMLQPPSEEVYTKGVDDMTHEERVEFATTRQSKTYLTENMGLRKGSFESDTLEALEDEDSLDDAAKKSDKKAKKKSKKATKKAKKAKKTVDIPFMYLGDIIDNVIEQIKLNNAEELNFKFFMSEVELIDPLVAYQVKNFGDFAACGNVKDAVVLSAMEAATPGVTVMGSEGLLLQMSIGDIPISLDAFQQWFTDKVIKKSLDKYYFLNFIKDIASQLISNALKARCYGKKYKFFQRFDAQPINLGQASSLKSKTRIGAKSLANYKRKLTCESSATESLLAIVLMSTDTKPKSLQGDFEQDLENGIYHNYIGSSCGLVKKINFNREDQPYLRESKIQKQGALGAAQLRELYSVNIDLVGNNLYRNGSYIYVSPLLLDTTMEELEFLGLHGYYLVTSVGSVLTESSFTTNLKALHEGVKFPNTKLGTDSQLPAPPAPSTNPFDHEAGSVEMLNAARALSGKPPLTQEEAEAAAEKLMELV